MVGERISGLANAAALEDRRVAYLIWGVDDTTHEIVGVTEDFPTVKVDKGQEMEAWLRQRLSRNGDFSYESVMIDGHKVGIVMITPAVGFPRRRFTSFLFGKGIRFSFACWRKGRPFFL